MRQLSANDDAGAKLKNKDMKPREIGDIYKINGGSYKIVDGDCSACDLEDSELCYKLPPCDDHMGRYIKVDAGDELALNIQHVSGCACPMESTEVYDDDGNYLGYVCLGCSYFSKH